MHELETHRIVPDRQPQRLPENKACLIGPDAKIGADLIGHGTLAQLARGLQLLGKVGDNGGVHRHKYGKLQKKAADEQPEREFFDWMPIDKPDEQNARGRSQC